MSPSLIPDRVGAAIQRYGAGGLLRQLATRVRNFAYMDEEHVWYVLDTAQVPELALAEGYRLSLATDEDEDKIGTLPTPVPVEEARRRRAEGNDLWFVLHGDELAFACWIFPRVAPVRAAATHQLEMPEGVVTLEDSFTSADHRGKGIAGAAWTEIARGLGDQGVKALITKVGVENVPSRKAVTKAGFREASVMHLRRRGPRERVSIEREPTELSPAAERASAAIERALAR